MSREKSEKIRVARASVFAAVLLTGVKLAVGIWTGSLGILSEAAHSALEADALHFTSDIASRVEARIRPVSSQIATINIHTEPL